MQSTKVKPGITQAYSFEQYLKEISAHCGEDDLLRQACQIVWELPSPQSNLPSGLDVALILAELGVDKTTLIVTLLSDFRLSQAEFIDQLAGRFGEEVQRLVKKSAGCTTSTSRTSPKTPRNKPNVCVACCCRWWMMCG